MKYARKTNDDIQFYFIIYDDDVDHWRKHNIKTGECNDKFEIETKVLYACNEKLQVICSYHHHHQRINLPSNQNSFCNQFYSFDRSANA